MPPAVKGPVTGLARLGGLFLLLIGLLWAVVGGAFIAGGALLKGVLDVNDLPGFGDALGGALAVIGIVILVFAIIEILGGIGALIGKDWARWIGVIYALIFGSFSLLILVSGSRASDVSNNGALGAIVFFLVHVVLYAYVLIIFIARWRGRATA
jgi:hypothetical protein